MKRLILAAICSILLTGCLAVPEGTHVFVSSNGCTSSGTCPFSGMANYYWASEREAVVAPGQSAFITAHELCHAHQHYVILKETDKEPSINLSEWYNTEEGKSFVEMAEDNPFVWQRMSRGEPLEDFANTCSYWFVDPETLKTMNLARYNWAKDWLSDGGF